MADRYLTGFDVIIIGGGPGGLSAALACADLGLKAIVVEKEKELGGQLLWTFNAINNYPGVTARNGKELQYLLLEHICGSEFRSLLTANVINADLSKMEVTIDDGTRYKGKAIIIATGVRRRKLGIQGEIDFIGSGILRSGSKDRETVKNKTVVIVGGGDAALENAIILSETAKKVIVVHRGFEFSARSSFVENVKNRVNASFMFDTKVTAITGENTVRSVDLSNTKTGKTSILATDHVLIRIGVVPNTENFRGQIALDKSGYIEINSMCASNISGVYAIGDVTGPAAPTIANAAGQGSTAAKSILETLF